jgi:hypothetical protein
MQSLNTVHKSKNKPIQPILLGLLMNTQKKLASVEKKEKRALWEIT